MSWLPTWIFCHDRIMGAWIVDPSYIQLRQKRSWMSWNANKALELMFCGVLRGHFGHFCFHRCTCRHFCQKNFLSQRNSLEQWKNLVVSHYPSNLRIMYKHVCIIYIYTCRFIISFCCICLLCSFISFISLTSFVSFVYINKCCSFQIYIYIYFIYNLSSFGSRVYTILIFWYKPSEWLHHFPWYWYGFHALRARGLSGLSHAYRPMV